MAVKFDQFLAYTSSDLTTRAASVQIVGLGNNGFAQLKNVRFTLEDLTNYISSHVDTSNLFSNGGNSFAGSSSSIGNNNNIPFLIKTNNLERARVFANGRFGFGTSTDAGYQFDFFGTTRIRATSVTFDNATNGNLINFISNVTSPYISLFKSGVIDARLVGTGTGVQIAQGSGFTNADLVLRDGYFSGAESQFGGTTSARIYLHAASGNNSAIRVQEDGVANRGIFGWAGGSSIFKMWVGASATALGSGTFAISVDSSGLFGGGTETPTARIHAKGANGYDQLRMETSYTPSATADSNGNIGDIAWDADYVYIKTAAGWKRSALSTF